MTSVTTSLSRAGAPVRALGLITCIAGLAGAACAVVVLAWPHQVSQGRYSYPFDTASYTAAQSLFALQHLALVAGLCGLALIAWESANRLTRAGLVVSILGMVGLTACELFAISAADALAGSSRADAVDNAYGAPMIGIGLGLVMAGVGPVRRPVLAGAGRWLPLATGIYVFVVLFPAVFGPMAAGRIAIGVWMLLFAWLGARMTQAAAGTRDAGVGS